MGETRRWWLGFVGARDRSVARGGDALRYTFGL